MSMIYKCVRLHRSVYLEWLQSQNERKNELEQAQYIKLSTLSTGAGLQCHLQKCETSSDMLYLEKFITL